MNTKPWLSRAAAIFAVAATYFYFLIFAEFAFLELAGALASSAGTLRPIMLALGFGGIAGGMGAAWGWREERAATMLAWSFRASGVGALFALAAPTIGALAAAGMACGVSLGALTVTLATRLRGAIGAGRLGLGVGVGTGLAYAACNVPAIFQASATLQTVAAALAVGAASFLPRWMAVEASARVEPASDNRSMVARWTAILLALVWLDSAAFYIVQHTLELRAETWSATGTLWTNAGVHLVAAMVAGWWLDRGRRGAVAGLALIALAVAGSILNGTLPRGLAASAFYTAGVSLYSVVLVEFPARNGKPWVAALVFAVAGWVGSALGIGMAQDLAEIPPLFIGAAVALVAVTLLWRTRGLARAAVAIAAAVSTVRADEVTFGREVYIAEGCMHCHSQYIRPRVASEVLAWGPARTLDEALATKPPLFGTRRQGPDLSHVGNRRSIEWNRLHLMTPQAVSLGSRMPSYAYLFRGDGERGEALLTYLASLGAETMEQRRQQIAAWTPDAGVAIAPAEAETLFARLCVQCHGMSGRGDGVLAAKLSVRPPDWASAAWRHVRGGEDVEVALSRIIKFGVPGLPMAGHEYVPDAEIVGLARYVRRLHNQGGSGMVAVTQP